MNKKLLTITFQVKDWDKSLLSVIKQAVHSTLDHVGDKDKYSLSILICDEQKIRELNKTYRGIEKTTDVLSFSSGERFPDSDEVFLGDIVISYPTTVQQAMTQNHTINHELSLLCVHGVLHLLGYDHATTEEEEEMWQLQGSILGTIGFKL